MMKLMLLMMLTGFCSFSPKLILTLLYVFYPWHESFHHFFPWVSCLMCIHVSFRCGDGGFFFLSDGTLPIGMGFLERGFLDEFGGKKRHTNFWKKIPHRKVWKQILLLLYILSTWIFDPFVKKFLEILAALFSPETPTNILYQKGGRSGRFLGTPLKFKQHQKPLKNGWFEDDPAAFVWGPRPIFRGETVKLQVGLIKAWISVDFFAPWYAWSYDGRSKEVPRWLQNMSEIVFFLIVAHMSNEKRPLVV